jgi:hypothetical protein
LRILNSLFFAVAKMNGKPSVSGREARQIHNAFFQQHFHLSLDKPRRSNRRTPTLNTASESSDTRLCLCILKSWGSEDAVLSWQDDDEQKLETHMTDIAAHIVLRAEIDYRESAVRHHQWRVQRKAEREEEARKRKLEAERAEEERKRRLEQARVDRLLRDAAAFQQAGVIRQYVEATRSALAKDDPSSEEVELWSQWALAQADRIDPVVARHS